MKFKQPSTTIPRVDAGVGLEEPNALEFTRPADVPAGQCEKELLAGGRSDGENVLSHGSTYLDEGSALGGTTVEVLVRPPR